MTIQTIILNKTRPNELKTAQLDPYFRLLENLLAQLAKTADAATTDSTIGLSLAYAQSRIDELAAIIADTDPRLTADCFSLTIDSDYISADIA